MKRSTELSPTLWKLGEPWCGIGCASTCGPYGHRFPSMWVMLLLELLNRQHKAQNELSPYQAAENAHHAHNDGFSEEQLPGCLFIKHGSNYTLPRHKALVVPLLGALPVRADLTRATSPSAGDGRTDTCAVMHPETTSRSRSHPTSVLWAGTLNSARQEKKKVEQFLL